MARNPGGTTAAAPGNTRPSNKPSRQANPDALAAANRVDRAAGRVANVQRIARARANRSSVDQRRSTADSRMYSENKARMALGFYTGTRMAGAMKTGAEVRAKMLASLRRAKGLPAGQSGYREPRVRIG